MFKIILLLTIVTLSHSFPDGAPIDACVKSRPNQPNHGAARSQPLSTFPYRLIASSDRYGPGTVITVTIETDSVPFKGFFLQARSLETNEWIGTWEKVPNTTVHPECSAVTHADPREKTKATLLWKAPVNKPSGGVYFTGTVLKSYDKFWAELVAQVPREVVPRPFIHQQFV